MTRFPHLALVGFMATANAQTISLNAQVVPNAPYATADEDGTYSGFHFDLLDALKGYASDDGVTLDVTFEGAATADIEYNAAFESISKDCSANCDTFDMVLGDFFLTQGKLNGRLKNLLFACMKIATH
jgi:hypothetical protein